MEHVYLVGSETVGNAARAMGQAAEQMQRAASSIHDSVERLRVILDEHATRLENAAKETP